MHPIRWGTIDNHFVFMTSDDELWIVNFAPFGEHVIQGRVQNAHGGVCEVHVTGLAPHGTYTLYVATNGFDPGERFACFGSAALGTSGSFCMFVSRGDGTELAQIEADEYGIVTAKLKHATTRHSVVGRGLVLEQLSCVDLEARSAVAFAVIGILNPEPDVDT